MNKLVDDFELSLNHAAKVASAKASDVFACSIPKIMIYDSPGIR